MVSGKTGLALEGAKKILRVRYRNTENGPIGSVYDEVQ